MNNNTHFFTTQFERNACKYDVTQGKHADEFRDRSRVENAHERCMCAMKECAAGQHGICKGMLEWDKIEAGEAQQHTMCSTHDAQEVYLWSGVLQTRCGGGILTNIT